MTWVRELSKDAAGKLQVIEDEDPFRVIPTVNDIAGLVDAIASKCGITPRFTLKIYKLTAAGEWEKLKPSHLVEANTEESAYGFLVPN